MRFPPRLAADVKQPCRVCEKDFFFVRFNLSAGMFFSTLFVAPVFLYGSKLSKIVNRTMCVSLLRLGGYVGVLIDICFNCAFTATRSTVLSYLGHVLAPQNECQDGNTLLTPKIIT